MIGRMAQRIGRPRGGVPPAVAAALLAASWCLAAIPAGASAPVAAPVSAHGSPAPPAPSASLAGRAEGRLASWFRKEAAATDPVCGMQVDVAAARAEGLTAVHGGKTYYFCNAGCRDSFAKDPATYLGGGKAGGGRPEGHGPAAR